MPTAVVASVSVAAVSGTGSGRDTVDARLNATTGSMAAGTATGTDGTNRVRIGIRSMAASTAVQAACLVRLARTRSSRSTAAMHDASTAARNDDSRAMPNS